MHNAEEDFEVLAVAVHGALFALHGLALAYHLRRSRRVDIDVAVHAAALVYDGRAIVLHARRVRAAKSSRPIGESIG